MKKRVITVVALLGVGAATIAAVLRAQRSATAPAAGVSQSDASRGGVPANTICAAGKVEPVSEEIEIGSEVPGSLREVPVEEGQHLRKGQTIAVVDNADYAARVAQARATIAVRQAALDRVVNGARDEERREAEAAVAEARAVLENARAEQARKQSLFSTGDVSRSDWENAEREYRVAQARVSEALAHSQFLDAPARTDERDRAAADLALARAQLAESEALLEKTIVRAPFDGAVLKRLRKAGETVSDKGETPIVRFGDNSRLRVRVDVDETDVARVAVGQRAYFTARAFGQQRFWGTVTRLGQSLGKKNIDTGDPAEKTDTKVFETLVDLDGHPPLPSGLRVDSFILGGR
ncbi:MAG: HlyD family secretion protein [Bryobacteraceae bacterium]